MQFVSDYRNNAVLSEMFFELVHDSFGLDLRGWAQRGNWGESYVCYSIIDEGRMIANASVSHMELLGRRPQAAWQIGTVCTRPEYRGQGCARELLNRIIDAANGQGLFLFANPTARGLYEKLGFHPGQREVAPRIQLTAASAQSQAPAAVMPYAFRRGSVAEAVQAAAHNAVYSDVFDVRTLPSLAELYLHDYNKDDIWICDEAGICAVWSHNDDGLQVHALYGKRPADAERLLSTMAATGATQAEFEFMPDGWGMSDYIQDDGPDEMFTMNLELPERIAFPGLMRA